jgi:putative hemolysin
MHRTDDVAVDSAVNAAGKAFTAKMPVPGWERFFLPAEIGRHWSLAAQGAHGSEIFERFLDRLEVGWNCAGQDLARIPKQGPAVVVANHPFGLVEGAILGALLWRIRPDVKFLANSLLAGIPGIEDCLIPVNPFGHAAHENWRGLRHSISWLEQGGVLVTFPAGEVAAMGLPRLQIAEPEWNERIARIIRRTGARAVPVFFHGFNSAAFHIAGMIHPGLRTALLPRELLNKKGTNIRVAIGSPVNAEALQKLPTDRDAIEYLRRRTYLLQGREAAAPFRFHLGPIRARVAAPVEERALREEAEALPAENVLLESGAYRVHLAAAAQIPNTLREIGRLREIAFRKAGEGTGRSLDLDRFDRHYRHLWVSHRDTGAVCGAYRLCGTDDVDRESGLYTSTLFRFRPGLLEQLHPALELGRSFVSPAYQKSYQALLLLWKGIGRYVAREPRYRFLFGPVSISREYSRASRSLMVSYLETRSALHRWAGAVEPRRQFRASWRHGAAWRRGCDASLLAAQLADVDELSGVVADLEADGKGVPVLLRQYLQLGGAVLAFNVDRAFSNVLDGLVVVDLARLAEPPLRKYLGLEGANAFRQHHRLDQQPGLH